MTNLERDILRLYRDGCTRAEIAEILGIRGNRYSRLSSRFSTTTSTGKARDGAVQSPVPGPPAASPVPGQTARFRGRSPSRSTGSRRI